MISGRNTPSAAYSAGTYLSSVISRICTEAAITPMYRIRPRKLRSVFGRPAHDSAPGLSTYWNSRLFSGIVSDCTAITATPRPIAVSIFFEIARKVHMPRKNASARFSTNSERIARLM